MNDIEDFLPECAYADPTLVELAGLGRLRTNLWNQWRRMELALCNHDPMDGNVGPEALAELGKIVELTGVAVDAVLQASGRILEAGPGAQCPEPTLPFPEDTVEDQPQERVARNAGDITALPARAGEVAARSGASNGETGVAVGKTRGARGEAAVVIKKVGIEIDTTQGSDNAARLLAQDGTQEVDEEVETDNSASTRTVKAPTRQSIEELREVEPSRMQFCV